MASYAGGTCPVITIVGVGEIGGISRRIAPLQINNSIQLFRVGESPVRKTPQDKVFTIGEGILPGVRPLLVPAATIIGLLLPHEAGNIVRYGAVTIVRVAGFRFRSTPHTANFIGRGLCCDCF